MKTTFRVKLKIKIPGNLRRQLEEGTNSALIQKIIEGQVSPIRSNTEDSFSINIIIV